MTALAGAGYTKRTAWWEAAIMLRKLSVVAATIFLVGSDTRAVSTQLLSVVGILVISYVAQARCRSAEQPRQPAVLRAPLQQEAR